MTEESLAGIANLHGQVEALALFSGGVLQAAGWSNTGPADDMVAAVAETAHRFGLTQEVQPGMFVATPIGYRALMAIAHFNQAGKC